jgi:hypothetical protein
MEIFWLMILILFFTYEPRLASVKFPFASTEEKAGLKN